MRVLGVLYGGPPGGVGHDSPRLAAFAAAWVRLGPVDWAVTAASRAAAAAFASAWEERPGIGDGEVVRLEPPVAARHPAPFGVRPEHAAPKLPEVLGALDATVSRDQVAKLLKDVRYDFVWCADPVAMALYGKVRRDVPVILDVPAPSDPTDRSRRAWHRFERYVATAAHLATVPSVAAREALGVPGTMAVDPASPTDLQRFTEAVTTFSRWSDDVRGMRPS